MSTKGKGGQVDQEYNQALHMHNDRSPDYTKSSNDDDMEKKIKMSQRKKIEMCKKKTKAQAKTFVWEQQQQQP